MDHDFSSIFNNAAARHGSVLGLLEKHCGESIATGARILGEAVTRRACVFACGNGGSAADSQHFAAEFACRYKDDRQPLPAIALTTNTSTLTAVGNDYSFNDVFSRQIEALGRPGDVLVAFSTSGQSPNIIRAVEAAQRKKMSVIFMTGTKGVDMVQAMKPAAAVVVPTTETARIQEMHELVYHAWCEYIDKVLGVGHEPSGAA